MPIKTDSLWKKRLDQIPSFVEHIQLPENLDAYRRYRHRLSAQGEPYYDVAVVAKKLLPIPEILL